MTETEIIKGMTRTLKTLGEEIRATDTYKAYRAALDTYTRSEDLNRMVFEYNVHQQAIAEEYKKDNKDQAVIDSITKRVNELYEQILSHKDYKDYAAAQSNYEKLMQAVYDELNYQITGKRACTHDCSSCAGCSGKSEK